MQRNAYSRFVTKEQHSNSSNTIGQTTSSVFLGWLNNAVFGKEIASPMFSRVVRVHRNELVDT